MVLWRNSFCYGLYMLFLIKRYPVYASPTARYYHFNRHRQASSSRRYARCRRPSSRWIFKSANCLAAIAYVAPGDAKKKMRDRQKIAQKLVGSAGWKARNTKNWGHRAVRSTGHLRASKLKPEALSWAVFLNVVNFRHFSIAGPLGPDYHQQPSRDHYRGV